MFNERHDIATQQDAVEMQLVSITIDVDCMLCQLTCNHDCH